MSILRLSAAILVAGASALAIQAPAGAKPVEESAAEPVNNDLQDYYQHMYAKRFDLALKSAGRLDAGPANPSGEAMIATMRASALLGLKRDKEAMRLIAQADKLAPQEPDVLAALFFTAMLPERFDVAADAFDKLIARAPDKVREQDRETVWHFLRNQPTNDPVRNDDRTVALARLGYGGEGFGDYMSDDAVEILVKRGDFAGAADLIRYIDEPQLIENFLIQRRYEKLWPTVEEQAGPQLAKVRASSVRSAERAVAENPDDGEKFHLLVNALRHAGRLEEAIALQSTLPATREDMSKANEQVGWAVNEIALALHEANRGDEADQLFARLNEAAIEDDFWLVSMKINRLELLVTDGKFDRALPLIEPTAKAKGSAYAEQLVRRLRYCTLSGLGRKAEAAQLLPDLLAHAKDAPSATVDGLICAGELDHAEKLALESLKDEKFQTDFVRSLQARPLTSDDPSVWQRGWQALRSRPAVAAEFARLGRDIPEQYLPPAH